MVIVGVIGGRDVSPWHLGEAEKVGRLVALKGGLLICGGLEGVMEAVCKGAKKGGGLTVGVLPQGDKKHANRYVDIPIATGMGAARNAIIAQTADVLIAIGGSYGTLSEIAYALQFNKPVIGLKTWDVEGVIVAETAAEAVEKAFSYHK
ncbi:TIGR00725 family protein [Candidatus Magnetominusculus dajiuhuensis]|uniref:TIGR00725 family protein n=1 Tax=Candidatus Magnetominusculus dajiuhuensis TaxID=3137712 RepID=UPI003B434510